MPTTCVGARSVSLRRRGDGVSCGPFVSDALGRRLTHVVASSRRWRGGRKTYLVLELEAAHRHLEAIRGGRSRGRGGRAAEPDAVVVIGHDAVAVALAAPVGVRRVQRRWRARQMPRRREEAKRCRQQHGCKEHLCHIIAARACAGVNNGLTAYVRCARRPRNVSTCSALRPWIQILLLLAER